MEKRTYGQNFETLIKNRIKRCEKNLTQVEYGSERYLIIKDLINRDKYYLSKQQRLIRKKGINHYTQYE